jgi:glucose-6-phosphate 1-epimerase
MSKQTRDGAIYQEGREVVTVNEWTDRIYQHTQQEHIITNVVSGRKMRLQKYNFPDTVIWNPWLDKARETPDFGDDEYPNMVIQKIQKIVNKLITFSLFVSKGLCRSWSCQLPCLIASRNSL